MASPGVVDPGGLVILDAPFVSSGTGLDTQRWTNGGGDTGNTQQINANRLRLVTGAASFRNSHIFNTALLQGSANIGVLCRMEFGGTNGAFSICLRGQSLTWDATSGNAHSCYSLYADVTAVATGTKQWVIGYNDNTGAGTTIGSSGLFTFSAAIYWVRFEAIGSTLRAKIWLDNTTEPAAWTVTGTDTNIQLPGMLSLCAQTQNTSAATNYVHRWISYIPETSAPLLPLILQFPPATTVTFAPEIAQTFLPSSPPQPSLTFNALTPGTPPPTITYASFTTSNLLPQIPISSSVLKVIPPSLFPGFCIPTTSNFQTFDPATPPSLAQSFVALTPATPPATSFYVPTIFGNRIPTLPSLITSILIPGIPPVTLPLSLPIWNTAMSGESGTLGWPTTIHDTINAP